MIGFLKTKWKRFQKWRKVELIKREIIRHHALDDLRVQKMLVEEFNKIQKGESALTRSQRDMVEVKVRFMIRERLIVVK